MKKAKCKICGLVEIPDHFEDQDGVMSIPVIYCPTLKDVAKFYKDIVGSSYKKNTGNNLRDSFEKGFVEASHESPDDIGWEEAKKHTLEPIECWCEQI